MKIDGKKVAADILARLKGKPTPERILAAVLIGEDERSLSFVRQKEKASQELGVDFRLYRLKEDLGTDGLRKEVGRISGQKSIGAVLIQLPLPKGLGEQYILNAVPREKDIDVLGERAIGAFYNDRNLVLPPAVETVKAILEITGNNLKESTVAVVGLGRLVGKPVALWLSGRCKDLHLLYKDSDKKALANADIVISGVGRAGVITSEMLKEGAGVIDFGYYFSRGKVLGDFDAEGDTEKIKFYTPTPGGTGPILVAKLMENFYTLCES